MSDMNQVFFPQETLQGYPGAALILQANGSVKMTNAKGEAFSLLIAQQKLDALENGALEAIETMSISVSNLTLDSSHGSVLLEATFVPFHDKNSDNDKPECMVLIRDLTMEKNLRSALVESRQRYKDLVEVSSDFAWEVDSEGVFQFVSPKGALGFTADEIVGRAAIEIVVDSEYYNPLPFVSEKPLGNVEMWLVTKSKATACVLVSCEPLFDQSQNWTGTRGVCRDVTEERANEGALARARHREYLLNHIVHAIRDEIDPLNMLSAAAAATAEAMVSAGARIYRATEEGQFSIYAEIGKTKGLDDLEPLLDKLEPEAGTRHATINNLEVLYAPTLYRKAINGVFVVSRDMNETEWTDDDSILLGDVANQLGIANEQIANHERIVALSRTDGLTGLLNRRAFFSEELPRHISRLEREGQSAALFYIDMDNFKLVNDTHGHQIGDEAILMLRQLMIENSRPGDVAARFGGDEFALWLDNISEDIALNRAEGFLKSSERLRQFSGSEDRPLGISIGVAMFHAVDNEALDDLITRADEAMYEAKRAGKGGIKVARSAGSEKS